MDPNTQAQKLGFKLFKDLLESEMMKGRVTIEDIKNSEGAVSRIYKAIPEEKYRYIYEEQRRSAREKAKELVYFFSFKIWII